LSLAIDYHSYFFRNKVPGAGSGGAGLSIGLHRELRHALMSPQGCHVVHGSPNSSKTDAGCPVLQWTDSSDCIIKR